MMNAVLSFAAKRLPPDLFARFQCLTKLGYLPELRRPQRFTELLLAKRLYDRSSLIPQTADKYTVRSYVEDVIGKGYLPELYDVVESADEVDLTRLPRAYVMKGTHGSGWNLVVNDGELTNSAARVLAAAWLGDSYYTRRQEWAYRELVPRVLFEENLLPGRQPDDIKVFVFAGVPRLIQVDRDRASNHSRALFTPDWQPLTVLCGYPAPASTPTPPRRLSTILDLASTLGEPFDFVRVDFYSIEDRVVVGEMTHYPDSGVVRFRPLDFDRELGEVWRTGRPVAGDYVAR